MNYHNSDKNLEIDEDMIENCDTQLRLKDIDDVTELETREEAKNPSLAKPKIKKTIPVKEVYARVI